MEEWDNFISIDRAQLVKLFAILQYKINFVRISQRHYAARAAYLNNVMHAKPDLRVFLKWMIADSGSVITAVIRLWFTHPEE